jgi:hypothetical protein
LKATRQKESKTPEEITKIFTTKPTTMKEGAGIVQIGGELAIIAVAKGTKATVYDLPKHVATHPIQTAKQMIDVPGQVMDFCKGMMVNPIGTVVSTGTSLFIIGKATKQVAKVLPTKVTTVKGVSVESMNTIRNTPKGVMVKEPQILIKTVETSKWVTPFEKQFWKPTRAPRKVLLIEGRRVASAEFDRVGYTQSTAEVKAKLMLKGNKAELKVTDYKEVSPPSKVVEPSVSYTGKTKSNVPLKGKTPTLKTKPEINIVRQKEKFIKLTEVKKNTVIESGGLSNQPIISEITKVNNMINWGEYNPFKRSIKLKKELPKKIQEEVLIHESGHHIDIARGFSIRFKHVMKKNPTRFESEMKKALIDFPEKDYLIRNYKPQDVWWERRADMIKEFIKDGETMRKEYPEFSKVLEEHISPKIKRTTTTKKIVDIDKAVISDFDLTGSKLFRNKKPVEGELIAETQIKGEFVKRKYERKPIEKKLPEPTTKPTLGKGFYKTESGKVVFLGDKPLSPALEQVKKNIESNSRAGLVTVEKPVNLIKGKTVRTQKTVYLETRKSSLFDKGLFAPAQIEEQKQSSYNILDRVEAQGNAQNKIFQPQEVKQENRFSIIGKVSQGNANKVISGIKPMSIIDKASAQSQDNIFRQEPIVEQSIRTAQATSQLFNTQTTTKTKPIETTVTNPKTWITPFVFGKPFSNAGQKERGFNVYMKEGGKLVKANESPLPKAEAYRLGKDIADNSLSASFKLSETNISVPKARRSSLALGGSVPDSKFSISKKRPNWVNEKNSNRLDSFGERTGIKASKLIKIRKNKGMW